MSAWWQGLNPRERLLVAAGAAVLAIALLYLLVWEPLDRRARELEQGVAAQRELVEWMQQARVQLAALRTGDTRRGLPAGQSLLVVTDNTARAQGLGEQMKQVRPESDGKVRIWFEGASFDRMARWLALLEQSYGIQVDSISVEPRDRPALVDARITLAAGAAGG